MYAFCQTDEGSRGPYKSTTLTPLVEADAATAAHSAEHYRSDNNALQASSATCSERLLDSFWSFDTMVV